ncbi:MAG: FkbM family methyltransferase [Pseudomonadota bacterium]
MIPKVKRVSRRLRRGLPVQSGPLTLVHTRVAKRRVTFCINNPRDIIQRVHLSGQFYETPELMALRNVFPRGGTLIDIGANIGNHTVFAALIWGAGRVIPIEPNPLAFGLLIQNVLVNRQDAVVDFSHLGVGLSDAAADGFAMQERKRNLGAAKMLPGEGDLSVVRGDVLLNGVRADLIKIDVEGMEMNVLAGLEGLLTTDRPMMLIEVDNHNASAFADWTTAHDYACAATVSRGRSNRNHLLVKRSDLERIQLALSDTALASDAKIEV